MNNKNYEFYVIKEDGIRTNAEVLSKIKLNTNDYIAYTFNEINENEMIKIYVTGIIEENGMYSYKEINDEGEWNNLKEILKTLAKDESENFPNTIKSDLKIVGEEISIRNPKKLLVSQKFANALKIKYKEDIPVKEELKSLDSLKEETKQIPAEKEIEKTIKIPTFEELQERSKNIQAAMKTAKETKVQEVPEITPVSSVEPTLESKIITSTKRNDLDYEEKFKKDIEPVLYDVYAKQQKHIEELEEELSKTKFDLFEKQKEALSLSNEKAAMERRSSELENELNGVQAKMNGILEVLQGSRKE